MSIKSTKSSSSNVTACSNSTATASSNSMLEQSLLANNKIDFNNYLVEFIDKMRTVVSNTKDFKRQFAKYYKYYRTFCESEIENDRRIEFIIEFVELLSKYNKEISICDEGLFSDDQEYYPKEPIYLLKYIDFKDIWHSVELSSEVKENIWKYLKTLYIIGTHIVKSVKEYSSIVKKHQSIIKDMINSIKMDQKIKNDAKNQLELDKLQEEADKVDFSSIFEIFGEDNLITSIVVEIAKEMNLSKDMLSNPLTAFTTLMGPDPTKLNGIMAKIAEKVREKMELRGVTEEDLLADAKKIQERLLTKFKNIPNVDGMENIGIKLYEYLKQAMNKAEAEVNKNKNANGDANEDANEDANGDATGDATQEEEVPASSLPVPSLDDLKKEFETFQKSLYDIDPSVANMNFDDFIKSLGDTRGDTH
jgi:hypothetical protein